MSFQWHVSNEVEDQAQGQISLNPVAGFSSKANYVNGGITFNYPPDLFTANPNVVFGIRLLNLVYAADLNLSIMITANSKDSTTLRVNKGALEAATDDVVVYIYAGGA